MSSRKTAASGNGDDACVVKNRGKSRAGRAHLSQSRPWPAMECRSVLYLEAVYMPFLGIGFHVIVALFFAVHAVRTHQSMYWLFILFAFPLLGSVAYFFCDLPA
ncbi:conserved transmembrane protein of unknown function [Ralstonia solanacearum Po82]|uniref:Uncharacterized protein n=1 Tax=Ralstonia solanacearum (strain Po82) TaxID=1031711 RepID=F6G2J0_RALS8|nr:conserved transmembrane protein of unknown function [Ralstonia solanacearum Po82]